MITSECFANFLIRDIVKHFAAQKNTYLTWVSNVLRPFLPDEVVVTYLEKLLHRFLDVRNVQSIDVAAVEVVLKELLKRFHVHVRVGEHGGDYHRDRALELANIRRRRFRNVLLHLGCNVELGVWVGCLVFLNVAFDDT